MKSIIARILAAAITLQTASIIFAQQAPAQIYSGVQTQNGVAQCAFGASDFSQSRYYTMPRAGDFASTLAANTMYFMPFCMNTNFSKIGILIGTGASGVSCDIGIYSSVAGVPNALMYDAGAVSVATAGYKEITGLPLSGYASGRMVWEAILCNGAPSVESAAAAYIFNNAYVGDNTASAGTIQEITASQTYGALPQAAPSLTYNIGAPQPLVFNRL